MKRLLICLVALIAVFALVMPASAAEMKVNGIWNAKAWARDNYDGDDDTDDATQYVTQRFRSYWNWIASENLKLVYKNEIDIEWGDSGPQNGRNSGGGLSGDSVNLETKNIYLEFMVPDTPVKATLGLQGITLHKGWFISDDAGGARFDMNFDPVSITAYWIGVDGLEGNDSVSSDDIWQVAVSGAYKAENMDARLSLAYQRNDNDLTSNDVPESDDLYLLMGEFGMSFDMVSFDIVAATNFGEVDSDGAGDRDYEGFMFAGSVDIALDMATITVSGAYASGDDEGDLDSDFQGLAGQTFSWAEIISDGYSYDRNASLAQIGGANRPSNMYYVAAGVDLKPTDTTTIMFDVYYVGMVEDRTIAGEEEDEIGIEVDARLTQKIYDNLSMTIIGAYMFAEDGYGVYDPADLNAASNSGDDAFHVGLGLDFKF
jgi:hypothetical protein